MDRMKKKYKRNKKRLYEIKLRDWKKEIEKKRVLKERKNIERDRQK